MTDTVDIKSNVKPAADRAEVIERLHTHEGELRDLLVTSLYLFGSAARDEIMAESDVDVFIDFDRALPFSLIDQIRIQRRIGYLLGRFADMTTRGGLHPELRSEIEASSLQVF